MCIVLSHMYAEFIIFTCKVLLAEPFTYILVNWLACQYQWLGCPRICWKKHSYPFVSISNLDHPLTSKVIGDTGKIQIIWPNNNNNIFPIITIQYCRQDINTICLLAPIWEHFLKIKHFLFYFLIYFKKN